MQRLLAVLTQSAGLTLLLVQCRGIQLGMFSVKPQKNTSNNSQQVAVQESTSEGILEEGDHKVLIAALETEDKEQLAKAFCQPGSLSRVLDSQRLTPLMWAARSGKEGALWWLLGHGADPRAKDKQGHTALAHAQMHNHLSLVKLLAEAEKRYQQGEALRTAIRRQDQKAAHVLIEANAAVNVQDAQGRTPLVEAVSQKDEKLVQALIDAKADLGTQNKHGYTALMQAEMKKYALYYSLSC